MYPRSDIDRAREPAETRAVDTPESTLDVTHTFRYRSTWRICFEWPDGSAGPVNVEIVDYH
jgi:plasmid maintenance system killer protein